MSLNHVFLQSLNSNTTNRQFSSKFTGFKKTAAVGMTFGLAARVRKIPARAWYRDWKICGTGVTLPGGYKSESIDVQVTDSSVGRGAINGYRRYRPYAQRVVTPIGAVLKVAPGDTVCVRLNLAVTP